MGTALRATKGMEERNLAVVLGGRGEEVDCFDGINEGQREKLKAQPLQREPRAKARKMVYIRWQATLKNLWCMDE